MKFSDNLRILSQIIQFIVFIYFIISLLKINALDIYGLLISSIALLISIIVDIISAIEQK
jgi:hypothetical protein